MEARAKEPRYTVTQAATLIARPSNTVSRWSLGHRRIYQGAEKFDKPLIDADGVAAKAQGEPNPPLSFLNLLELRLLSYYRNEAALQAIRRALDYTGSKLGIERPLISVEFKVHGGELFAQFAETEEWRLLVNASRGGRQLSIANLVAGVQMTENIDYDDAVSRRWWYKGRDIPVYVDTRVAGGRPITATTGLRLDAITARKQEGLSNEQIMEDTGATEGEVIAALLAAA